MSYSVLNSLDTTFYKICISNAVGDPMLGMERAYLQKAVSFLILKGCLRCIYFLTAFILLGAGLKLYI